MNGFAGVDFQRSDLSVTDLEHAVEGLTRHATGAILFTLITDHVDALCSKLEAVERIRRSSDRIAQALVGYHIEGPWISSEPGYHGAHPIDKVCLPSLSDYARLRVMLHPAGSASSRWLPSWMAQ